MGYLGYLSVRVSRVYPALPPRVAAGDRHYQISHDSIRKWQELCINMITLHTDRST
jgi:hypothetical protein